MPHIHSTDDNRKPDPMTQLHTAREAATRLFHALSADENGFIVSAELVLVATIAVLGMVVGLSEVANNVNQELEDVGSAFSSLDQTFEVCGTRGHKGSKRGSCFHDHTDYCSSQYDIKGN